MIRTSLFADRFLQYGRRRAIDLATGDVVSLRVTEAGTRQEQADWTERCARSLGARGDRALIDFGFLGRDRRFEAHRAGVLASQAQTGRLDRLTSSMAQVVEWVERGGSVSNVLRLVSPGSCTQAWVEAVARDVRVRGFIPVSVSMIRSRDEVPALLAGRSVVVFDVVRANDAGGAALCLSILQCLTAQARAVSAIVSGTRVTSAAPFLEVEFPRRPSLLQVAERGPVYGVPRRPPLVPPVGDSRAMTWLEDGRRLMSRGRHAAAERSLRASAAAFERRGDAVRAAEVLMTLGRLLQARGRAADAEQQFAAAGEKFQRAGAAGEAVSACVHAGLAQTDAGAFDRAEVTLKAALTAAHGLGPADDPQAIGRAGVALARNLYWQRRVAEGVQVLQSLDHHDCPRYWSVLARLHLAAGHVDAACHSARRAREALPGGDAHLEAVVRTAQAMVQSRLGDVDALCFHVRAGLVAARVARRPLQALRLRLTLIEGLLEAGLQSRARAAGRAAGAFGRTPLPRPLKERADRVVLGLADASPLEKGSGSLLREKGSGNPFREDRRKRFPEPFSRETAAPFHVDHTDSVAELLSACQGVDDERAALRSVAEIVRKQVGGVAVGIFGAGAGGAVPTAHASVGTIGPTLARRCMELGQPMTPETGAAGIEGAAPVRHLGRIIGAVACRWTVEGPRGSHDVLTFARIAAAACAPLLQILLERQSLPVQDPSMGATELIGVSAVIQEVRRSIAQAASAPFTVLIEGESGAGKELVATAIHRAGCRRDKAFRALNCAALTEELVDSELFGHAKGAFTGALNERLGLFESAAGGTVFLDEVGELSARAQAKLLRALQEGEIRRIGENFTRPIDARLIAATNRSLAEEAQAGRFRQDLRYRLDVIRITVPPLRERVEDIPLLALRFWRDAAAHIGSHAVLGQAALAALARYDWPGNVRELQNVLASLAVSVPVRGVVPASAMPAAIARAVKMDARETLDAARRRFEERFVRAALAQAAGHRGQTASALGVSRQGLAKLMQRLQLP